MSSTIRAVALRSRVSGASTQPTAAASSTAPLIAKLHSKDIRWAICPTASDPTIDPKSDIIW